MRNFYISKYVHTSAPQCCTANPLFSHIGNMELALNYTAMSKQFGHSPLAKLILNGQKTMSTGIIDNERDENGQKPCA